LGNHTVGVKALEAISETEEVVGVVAHPPDPEDGIRYLSVYDFAVQRGWKVIRSTGKNRALEHFISSAKPDLLWVTDYRYLLPASLLSAVPLGVVNLHPSLLPKYRGRAPINWAILNGETTLGLTAHFVDEGMDTGDIIEQIRFELREDQDVGDALELLYPLYYEISRRVLHYFHDGQVPRLPQDHSQATVFPRRRPEDGLIDWNQPAKRVRDLARAVAKPYPGAFSFWRGTKIIIRSAALYAEEAGSGQPGQVLGLTQNGFVVCAGRGTILVKRAEFADTGESIVLKTNELLRAT
jgi:methionyl-tRNA formyltransferase